MDKTKAGTELWDTLSVWYTVSSIVYYCSEDRLSKFLLQTPNLAMKGGKCSQLLPENIWCC